MARIRVMPFDELGFELRKKSVIKKDNPKYGAIRRAIWVAFFKTLAGYAEMGALCLFAYWYFNFGWSLSALWSVLGWGSLFWFGFPIVLWWFSADIVSRIQKEVTPDPNDERPIRMQRLLDEAYEESTLKFKPPLHISDDPMPNAAATGPIHRKAKVFVTTGFLTLSETMTDEEVKGVLAHELSHVANYDVAINSLISVLSMLFFLIVNAGVLAILGGIDFVRRLMGGMGTGWGGKIAGNLFSTLLLFPVFWFTSKITTLIQVFVVRSRESAADATAAYFTGDPCALATALQKLVDYVNNHRPPPGSQQFALYQVLRPLMIIDPLFDSNSPEPQPVSAWEKFKAFLRDLQLTHPPVPLRVSELERMNGGKCQRS
jgi:heat shock protein HtpX